ncbi:MAG: FAD-dependent oxidoreductase [Deltaproteobacteria bacterium]|nr:FAD-dependent oxidoreductase [Deltaproteobacteria bacterium]
MTTPPISPIFTTRREQAFPVLTAHQLAQLESYGTRRTYPAGALLFSEGERHVGMFVVLSGSVDITRGNVCDDEHVVTHTPGMFSGEIGLLSGRAAVATGRAHEDCEVLLIDEAALHRLVVSHAELSELIMRAFILRRVAMLDSETGGTVLLGSRLHGATHRLRRFLTRNAQPHIYRDLDHDAETAEWMEHFQVTADDLPVVITRDGTVLRSPTLRALADAIGLGPEPLDGRRVDVAVIGAGPAGLAAAVYAASEGLSVVVLDGKSPGGQAGSSSKIENYFGFPTGISGEALAGRGFVQAQKFGAEVAIPREVVGFECGGADGTVALLEGGERLGARAVVIATGAKYRKLDLPNLEAFEGRGIYYSAGHMEAQLCAGQPVIVVGGGNSAGQAAVFLSGHASHVHILVRAKSLAASMSDYLIQRIRATPNITLHTETQITALHGDGLLAGVDWQRAEDPVEPRAIEHVFLFCGADPSTGWLRECLVVDSAGFVKTGSDLTAEDLAWGEWPLPRPPMRFETSHPGVFAVGDVRSGSVKRCAAAVGEGSTAVQLIHAFLAENPQP